MVTKFPTNARVESRIVEEYSRDWVGANPISARVGSPFPTKFGNASLWFPEMDIFKTK